VTNAPAQIAIKMTAKIPAIKKKGRNPNANSAKWIRLIFLENTTGVLRDYQTPRWNPHESVAF
jgi:hypothetical protein